MRTRDKEAPGFVDRGANYGGSVHAGVDRQHRAIMQ